VELYKGKIFEVSPAPACKHQMFSAEIGFEIQVFLKSKLFQMFYAPFDARLQRNTNDKKNITVVQPDICDPGKIDERGCNGAPELIVEILSPGNSKKNDDKI
jgi:Uma2 family endonuclease